MLTPVHRRTGNRDQGFPLIELLVVTIIAMLVAIAIPVLLSQRAKAVDASRKSDLTNTVTALEAHHIAPQGYRVGGSPRRHGRTRSAPSTSTSRPGTRASYVDPATDRTVNAYCLTADNPADAQSRGFRSDVGTVQPTSAGPC